MSSPGTAMRPATASASVAGSRATTSGPDAVPERGAGSQRPVAIAQTCERADAELGQLELAAARGTVQILDVAQRRLHAQVAADELVHDRMERERVVGHGEKPNVSSCTRHLPRRGQEARGAATANASANNQRARSCSSTSFDTTRTSIAGTPAACGRAQHAVALHRLDVGVASRRRRGRSSRSDGRAPWGIARRAASTSAGSGHATGAGSERRRWSL